MSRTGETTQPLDDAVVEFWRERHLCTLTTLRPDGTPHVVPVGSTLDPETGTARVISSRSSRKVRNVLAAGEGGQRVALCQVDGARWATLEGIAVVQDSAASVAEAEARYTQRYRRPRENPQRVVIVITIDRVLGKG